MKIRPNSPVRSRWVWAAIVVLVVMNEAHWPVEINTVLGALALVLAYVGGQLAPFVSQGKAERP